VVPLPWLGWMLTDWRRAKGRAFIQLRGRDFLRVPEVEGQDSTKEPRCLACLRVLLPRVGFKEVNTIKQGGKQS